VSARGGVPECRGAGTKVTTRRNGGGPLRGRTAANLWKCDACGRFVPLNYDGTLRWHTPSPKRGK